MVLYTSTYILYAYMFKNMDVGFSGNIYEIYINVPMHPYRLCDSEVGQSQNIDMSFLYIYIFIVLIKVYNEQVYIYIYIPVYIIVNNTHSLVIHYIEAFICKEKHEKD